MTAPLFLVVLFILTAAGSLGAQPSHPPDPQVEVEIASGNFLTRRSGGAVVAATEAANVGADLGLDALFGPTGDRGIKWSLLRLSRLWLVNLPVASLGHAFAHDYGHFARLKEIGVRTRSRRITAWPWPVPITTSVEAVAGAPPGPAQLLGIVGGGEQASAVLRQTMLDKIYSRDSANYFDWLLFSYAALDFTAYNLVDLGVTAHSSRYFFRGAGDFHQYAENLAELDTTGFRPDTRARYEAGLRHDAWLNLVDYSLVAAVRQVAAYVVTGDRRAANPTLRIVGWRVVPGLHASLTSLGPERGLDVRLLSATYLSHLDLRRITTPFHQHLWGAGLQLRSREPARLRPEGRADLWQRPESGLGMRFEVGARRVVPATHQKVEGALRAGYKTSGYLVDAPQRAGLLFSLSATIHD